MRTQDWANRGLIGLVASVSLCAVSWCGWVTVGMFDRPTNDEVIHLIQTSAPYVEDRKMILNTVQRTEETNIRLSEAIENNTKAIIQLQVMIERLK
mgnify:FL=1